MTVSAGGCDHMTQQKKKVSRVAARKVKDKWKAKQWYTVRAPKMFNGVPIAETLADETPKLVGRVAEATLQDLTGDFSKMHVKLYFKVAGVRGTDCVTKFTGHELTSDYIRRLTRRKHSKVDAVVDVTTKDGYSLRVKPMAVTEKRAQSTQEQLIRKTAETVIKTAGAEKDLGTFVKEMCNGELAQVIYKEARVFYPLKRVEIRKSQMMAEPTTATDDFDIFAPAEATDGAAAEEAPAEEEMVDDIASELSGGEKTEEEL